VRDYVRERIPGIKFIHLKVDYDILLEKSVTRTEKMLAQAGMTLAQFWKFPDPDMTKARAEFGEEYDDE